MPRAARGRRRACAASGQRWPDRSCEPSHPSACPSLVGEVPAPREVIPEPPDLADRRLGGAAHERDAVGSSCGSAQSRKVQPKTPCAASSFTMRPSTAWAAGAWRHARCRGAAGSRAPRPRRRSGPRARRRAAAAAVRDRVGAASRSRVVDDLGAAAELHRHARAELDVHHLVEREARERPRSDRAARAPRSSARRVNAQAAAVRCS